MLQIFFYLIVAQKKKKKKTFFKLYYIYIKRWYISSQRIFQDAKRVIKKKNVHFVENPNSIIYYCCRLFVILSQLLFSIIWKIVENWPSE